MDLVSTLTTIGIGGLIVSTFVLVTKGSSIWSNIRRTVENIFSDVKEVRKDIELLKNNLSGMEDEMKYLRSDIHELRRDIQGLRSDIQGLQNEISGLRQDLVNAINQLVSVFKDFRNGVLLALFLPRLMPEKLNPLIPEDVSKKMVDVLTRGNVSRDEVYKTLMNIVNEAKSRCSDEECIKSLTMFENLVKNLL